MDKMNEINVNDPLYLHLSDTPGTNLIQEHLIGTENYNVWSRAMIIALCAKNKLGLVDGSCVKPVPNSPNLHQWERCNAIVLSWIMNTVSKEIFSSIIYTSNAASVWSDLKERFDKINGTRIYSLHKEIGRISQGNATVTVYFSRLKQLWDELACLVPLPSCNCGTTLRYVEHDQHQKLFQFLMGLNDSYGQIRSHILMMNPLPSFSQAFSIICQEESHKAVVASNVYNDTSTSAFFTSSQSKRKDEVEKCSYCNWPGHKKESCYKLNGYPPGHRLYKKSHKQQHNSTRRFSANQANSQFTQQVTCNQNSLGTDALTQVVPTFTQAQYEQILSMLSKGGSVRTNHESTVNMAGPTDWDDNGDW